MSWNEEARIGCRFHFKCPQLWSRLQPTPAESVRHCPECDRDVYLALTEEDFRRHSEDGWCIAVPVSRERGESQDEEGEYVVGMVETPYRSQ
jgi:hypothetical protein